MPKKEPLLSEGAGKGDADQLFGDDPYHEGDAGGNESESESESESDGYGDDGYGDDGLADAFGVGPEEDRVGAQYDDIEDEGGHPLLHDGDKGYVDAPEDYDNDNPFKRQQDQRELTQMYLHQATRLTDKQLLLVTRILALSTAYLGKDSGNTWNFNLLKKHNPTVRAYSITRPWGRMWCEEAQEIAEKALEFFIRTSGKIIVDGDEYQMGSPEETAWLEKEYQNFQNDLRNIANTKFKRECFGKHSKLREAIRDLVEPYEEAENVKDDEKDAALKGGKKLYREGNSLSAVLTEAKLDVYADRYAVSYHLDSKEDKRKLVCVNYIFSDFSNRLTECFTPYSAKVNSRSRGLALFKTEDAKKIAISKITKNELFRFNKAGFMERMEYIAEKDGNTNNLRTAYMHAIKNTLQDDAGAIKESFFKKLFGKAVEKCYKFLDRVRPGPADSAENLFRQDVVDEKGARIFNM